MTADSSTSKALKCFVLFKHLPLPKTISVCTTRKVLDLMATHSPSQSLEQAPRTRTACLGARWRSPTDKPLPTENYEGVTYTHPSYVSTPTHTDFQVETTLQFSHASPCDTSHYRGGRQGYQRFAITDTEDASRAPTSPRAIGGLSHSQVNFPLTVFFWMTDGMYWYFASHTGIAPMMCESDTIGRQLPRSRTIQASSNQTPTPTSSRVKTP